jgi:hypothetical protein
LSERLNVNEEYFKLGVKPLNKGEFETVGITNYELE